MNNQEPQMIDASLLVLDDRYQSRQPDLTTNKAELAAAKTQKDTMLDLLYMALVSGKGIETPLDVHVIDGVYYVVSGFHRTMACQKYLKTHKDKTVLVPAYVVENSTSTRAFRDSLTKNKEHGMLLSPSERWHNQFKMQLMEGEGLEILSGDATKALYGCGRTHGGYISASLRACVEVGLPSVAEWEKDALRAARILRERLKGCYDLGLDAFDKDGFPKAQKLAKAYRGAKEFDCVDDPREKAIKFCQSEIEKLLRYDPDAFRKALNKVNKKNLGITVKREWKPEQVAMEYQELDKGSFDS